MSAWWSLSVAETVVLIGVPVLGGAIGRTVAWLLVRRRDGRASKTSQVYAGDPGISARLEQMDEDVRNGKRSPESLALLPSDTVRGARIIRRPDADDEGTDSW